MFFRAEVPLGLPLGVAKQALERAVTDRGLIGESRRAISEGLSFVMGASGGHDGLAKQVVVRALPGRSVGTGYVVALRWEVPDPSGGLSAELDANLELSAIEPASSVLTILGCYEPALPLERAGISRVVSATAEAFLNEVSAQVAGVGAAAP